MPPSPSTHCVADNGTCAVCGDPPRARIPWRDRGWQTPPARVVGSRTAGPIWVRVPLEGIESARIAREAQRVAESLDGAQIAISPETQSMIMQFEAGACPLEQVAAALAPLGVRPVAPGAHRIPSPMVDLTISAARPWRPADTFSRASQFIARTPELALPLAGGVLLLAGFLVHVLEGPEVLRLLLVGASAVLTSTRTAPEAWESLREFRVNIDILMFAAAAGAASLGHYEEGAFLLFLFGLGAAGEHLALGHAHRAIEALADLAPDTAMVVGEDGEAREVPVDGVAVDATVLVRPFDRVALDAEVLEGRSAIDESTITGEPIPVDKSPGDDIFAGTMNTEGTLRVRVTRPATESTLARIMQLVAEAQARKSPTQLFTERVERWYVPFVFIATGALILLPPLLTEIGWRVSFYRAMAFMTAASPCALAIGTPATILCGVARAARLGVLVKGGGALEALGRVRAVAFDKTGTLTYGRPSVARIVAVAPRDEEDVLGLAAAVEAQVTHPLADAIVAAARTAGIPVRDADHVRQAAGAGAEGIVDGRKVTIGRPSILDDARWPASLAAARDELTEEGATLGLVMVDSEAVGLIGLADRIRAGAPNVVARLRQLGVRRMIMLTGDHEGTARHVAEVTGLDAWHAALRPEQKLEIIDEFEAEHGATAMVGDGVNDAPALAEASIGIAMGAAGADVAMETADIALMGTSLDRLPCAFELSRSSRRIIVQNMLIALVVIGIVAPLAALGFARLGLAVLLHEGSTIVVVLNALRLLRFRPSADE